MISKAPAAIRIIQCFMLSAFILFADITQGAILDNLVAYWKLDEATGNALDVLTNHNLTETSGTIASTTGKVGNARDFELGDTEWFAKAHHADLGNVDEDMTIACWVQLESKATVQTIVAKGTNSSSGLYALMYRNVEDRFDFRMFGAASFAQQGDAVANNFGSPSTATWYFLVAWHSASGDTLNIQVNNGTANSSAYTTGGHSESGGFLLGGGYPYGATAGEQWDGLIDECGIWKRVLTTDEKTFLYNSGNGRTYPFTTARARRKPVVFQ